MILWSFAFVACTIAAWYLLVKVVPASSPILRNLITLAPIVPLMFLFHAALTLLAGRDEQNERSRQALKNQMSEVQQVASENIDRLLHPVSNAGKHMRPAHRKYLRAFVPAMLGYVVVLFASILILKEIGLAAPVYWRAALALAPLIPIIFVCRAMIRFLQECDELERKIELEAIALSCLFNGLIFLALGFLASAKVIQLDGAIVAIWVFPGLCGLYGATKCIASWRYR